MRAFFSIYLILVQIIGFSVVCANNPFEPGYIVTLNNDTIQGLVEVKISRSTPGEVIFRETGGSSISIYSPGKILEFGTAFDVYKSAAVKISQPKYQFGELIDSIPTGFIVDTVFLRLIIGGEKELWYYRDSIGPEMFFIKDERGYDWLIHYSNNNVKSRRNQVVSNNNYIGQLILYLTGCKSMNPILSNTSYTMESLVLAFQQYYECINSSVDLYKPREYKRFELYAIAGVTLTKIGFGGAGYPYLTESNFPWSAGFSAGISGDLFLPDFLGRWSVNNELLFTHFQTNSTHTGLVDENKTAITHTDIGASYIKLNSMLRSTIPLLDVSLFFNFGVSNGIAISKTNKMRQIIVNSSGEEANEGQALSDFRNYSLGLIVGFGVKHKRLSAEARYEIGNSITGDPELSSNLNRFYFFLGYKILK
jgi:hypothetical protein